ncbi:hypothetical protein CYMTET_23290 [Cymbomonas tetramitiformis]|uniref:Uncharacterized protein n=1 Tax=Cymbomonas tetramitiformis TaxID=36881 RepID=A0AAE0FYI3_9CHLO|nr:hypothetical protein CYMTET_23290 [Cymbomonas tetramitiformis]
MAKKRAQRKLVLDPDGILTGAIKALEKVQEGEKRQHEQQRERVDMAQKKEAARLAKEAQKTERQAVVATAKEVREVCAGCPQKCLTTKDISPIQTAAGKTQWEGGKQEDGHRISPAVFLLGVASRLPHGRLERRVAPLAACARHPLLAWRAPPSPSMLTLASRQADRDRYHFGEETQRRRRHEPKCSSKW